MGSVKEQNEKLSQAQRKDQALELLREVAADAQNFRKGAVAVNDERAAAAYAATIKKVNQAIKLLG